jgi:hypothetical protein
MTRIMFIPTSAFTSFGLVCLTLRADLGKCPSLALTLVYLFYCLIGGTLDWRSIQTLVRSMPDLHKTLILADVRGDWKSGDAAIHELAMATEHAPFRHRQKITEVGGQRKKQKTG